MEYSLQLWSVGKAFSADPIETLKKLKSYGYDGVEFAGYAGISKEDMRKNLMEIGLYAAGSHNGIELFKDQLVETLEYNKMIGSNYMVCPCVVYETRQDVDEIIKILNDASEVAKDFGIKIGYHNHSHEFNKFDGEYILDLIAKNTNDNVILELDVFWTQAAGVDPYDYIEKWGKKIELIHIKQIGNDKTNVSIKEGIIDMKKIEEVSKFAKHFIIEQEHYTDDILKVTKENIEFMKSLSM